MFKALDKGWLEAAQFRILESSAEHRVLETYTLIFQHMAISSPAKDLEFHSVAPVDVTKNFNAIHDKLASLFSTLLLLPGALIAKELVEAMQTNTRIEHKNLELVLSLKDDVPSGLEPLHFRHLPDPSYTFASDADWKGETDKEINWNNVLKTSSHR